MESINMMENLAGSPNNEKNGKKYNRKYGIAIIILLVPNSNEPFMWRKGPNDKIKNNIADRNQKLICLSFIR